MVNKTSSYREALLESLMDPAEAAEYLNAAIEDSPESFLKAVGNVAQARQMAKVAKDAGVQRETMYRSFSPQGNPTFTTLSAVLHAVGLRILIGEEKEADTPIPPEPVELVQETHAVITTQNLGAEGQMTGRSQLHSCLAFLESDMGQMIPAGLLSQSQENSHARHLRG